MIDDQTVHVLCVGRTGKAASLLAESSDGIVTRQVDTTAAIEADQVDCVLVDTRSLKDVRATVGRIATGASAPVVCYAVQPALVDAVLDAGAADVVPASPAVGQSALLENRIHNIVEQHRGHRVIDDPIRNETSREASDHEQEAAYQRSLLETIIETSLDGQVVFDENREVVAYNERFLEMWGIPEAVMTGGSEVALAHVLDDLKHPEEFRDKVEYLYDHPDEAARDVIHLEDGRVFERYTNGVKDADGTHYGRVWSFRDVTAQQEHEAELRKERAFTESVFEALPDVLYAFDQYGNFLRWNDRLSEVTGYTDEEISSMTPADFVVSEDRQRVAEAIHEVFENDTTITIEARFERKDGTQLPYEFTGAKLVAEDGEVLGLVGVGRDITDRKERQRRFEAVFNNTYQFTGLLEPDGTLLEANDTALAFGGLDRRDILGKPLWDAAWFQSNEDAREAAKEAVEQAREGKLYRDEITVQGEAGTEVIDFSVRPIRDEQGAVRLLVPEGRQITELKQRERHLSVLNRFLRHNLRNKMTVIKGNASILRDTLADTTYEEYVTQVEDAASDLVELSETAHEFLETTIKTDPEIGPIELGEVLTGAVQDLRQQYPAASIEHQPRIDTSVYADWRLGVVFEHLIENAVVHAEDGSPTVEVRVEETEDTVRVRIADDGPGIPENELLALQGKQAGTQLTHASGFGLFLVQAVVDDYGGEVAYEPSPDGGSIITVSVQRATADAGVTRRNSKADQSR